MATATERRIIQERRAEETGWLLVPILEALLEQPCEPEDDLDFRFMDMLVRARAIPRAKGVFSPSMLGSCMRQAYFAKRGEDKHVGANPRANGYFLNGNFVHFKWQFACWKAHRLGMLDLLPVPIEHEIEAMRLIHQSGDDNHDDRNFVMACEALDFYGDGTRPGVEVRVMGEEDYGGTLDVILAFNGPPVPIDFKGVNQIDFQRMVKKGAKQEYRKQLVGYCNNLNASDLIEFWNRGSAKYGLLVNENKAGPDTSATASPIGLHETLVKVSEFEGEVARRLRTLRFHDDKNIVPPPECVSTRHMRFVECPFARHCTDEVKVIQREREARAERRNASRDWRVTRAR